VAGTSLLSPSGNLTTPAAPWRCGDAAPASAGGTGEHALTWCGLDLRWAYADLLPGISRRTNCVHRAYDVLHDALLRFALTSHRERVAQPHAYLRTVVRSVLADHYQEAARFEPLTAGDSEGDPGAVSGTGAPACFAPSAEHLADLQQRLAAVQRILDCLPPRCREVFWLFRVEGYRQPEIAERLGISLNMVERHVMRALLDLRAARELLS